jgi:hypothetical protein
MEAIATSDIISDPGPRPELRWIAINSLYIDHSYQRSTESKNSQNNLKYMEGNFTWAHCGALIVSKTDQGFAVLDGQHRLAAAKARGDITEMPCMVITGHDFKEQVSSFVIINTKRVALNHIAKFHAAAAAGDPDAVSIKAILDDCQIEIPKSSLGGGDTGPRQTQAIGALAMLIRNYSEKQIKWALTIIPEAYGEKRRMMRAMLIKALVEFISQNPDADRAAMISTLRTVEPADLEKDAQSYVKISGGSTLAAMVQALERYYKTSTRGKPVQSVVPPPKPAEDSQPSTKESDYIGQREDGQLLDSDWPDISEMCRKGQKPWQIAKQYNVDKEKMEQFIDDHLLADARAADKRSIKKKG